MYIPVSYWQTAGGVPHALGCYFATPFQGNNRAYTYVFDGTTINTTTNLSGQINKNCVDLYDIDDVVTGVTQLYPAGAFFFCSAKLIVGPSQCCINTPPETGPEAWYIDVSYRMTFNNGTMYYNYIDQFGNIINDTITFGQTKRIVAQAAPLFIKSDTNFFNFYMSWTMVERFAGEVIPYPYKDVPTRYTFTLKRDMTSNPGQTQFPYISYTTCSFVNGFPIVDNNGVVNPFTASAIGSTLDIVSGLPPLDANVTNNSGPGMVWITNAVPLTKGALNLRSCSSTHSLWVTLDNGNYYPTGSVLKVTNSQLTTTSSCWTVLNVSSSAAVPVAINDINVSASYAPGACILCLDSNYQPIIATGGNSSGSFVEGFTTYRYNIFSSSGNFVVSSGSVDNARILVVAGGGGGGFGGGGGAGGCVYSSSFSISQSTYVITIGAGGKGTSAPGTSFNQDCANGSNSSFNGSPMSVTAIGGGKGATASGTLVALAGGNGGSGGGGMAGFTGGSAGQGTAGQGNDGGSGQGSPIFRAGGGGGAGAAGDNSAIGGIGRQLGTVMFGSSSWFAGGGNGIEGSTYSSGSLPNNPGAGGKGGGGATAGITGSNGIVIITYPAF